MTRSRPLLGSGPGTFSNGFIPARAAAEARSGRRLVHRSGSAHFENAHSEPFTIAAECGLPAAVLAIAAFIWVTWKLARKRGSEDGPEALSDDTLVACLVAFGVLSLASFPLRLAVSAGPFAFLAGLALRRLSVSAPEEERRQLPPVLVYAAALALGLASLTRWTAFSRFAEAEGLVRTIRSAPPGVQPLALGDAGRLLESSLDLQPRRAVAWLTLGSVHRLLGDPDRAWEAFRTALLLEERAEIVINLSRLAEERGDRGLAEALALRAIWTLPRLIDAAPPSLDRAVLSAEIERRERAASPPPLPDI
jgi:tetratricopeptide (TPR) repeat protein